MEPRRWSCTHFSPDLLKAKLRLELCSTITYDTLVRAGASCTSAFVSNEERQGENTYENNPPFAKGSRGINILPDTYFSPQHATPVRLLKIDACGR